MWYMDMLIAQLTRKVQFYGIAHKPVIDVSDNDRSSEDYIVIGELAYCGPHK